MRWSWPDVHCQCKDAVRSDTWCIYIAIFCMFEENRHVYNTIVLDAYNFWWYKCWNFHDMLLYLSMNTVLYIVYSLSVGTTHVIVPNLNKCTYARLFKRKTSRYIHTTFKQYNTHQNYRLLDLRPLKTISQKNILEITETTEFRYK